MTFKDFETFWLMINPQKSNILVITNAPNQHVHGGKRRTREL